jgi:phosphoenolpyruvate-protein kinase (PTS system EI component)
VAVARAYCLDEPPARHEPAELDAEAAAEQLARLEDARAAAREELDEVIARVRAQVGDKEAAIFRAHRLLVDDPGLVAKVRSAVLERRLDARAALQATLDEYSALLAQASDGYLKERLADVRDVVGRLQGLLTAQGVRRRLALREPAIVVARELLPSQVVAFEGLPVAGIVTETGGATGHAAILARSLRIPAATGFRGLAEEVRTGDLLVLDGREGHVYVNPGPEVVAAYHTLRREYVHLRERLAENRAREAVTADGVRVGLLAEVDFVSVGSNDLIQYLMAADRDNPKVAHLCEPFYPALYRFLRPVVEACDARGKPVTLCGEMAGRPRCFLPLLGLGLRRLSMSPALVPALKELARRATGARARAAAAAALRLGTADELLAYLTRETREAWPEVTLLDTREQTVEPPAEAEPGRGNAG